ncbi:MAG TPA: hypothetical protein VFC06_05535, partial [Demequina sp.]|nr:hypothetical protein [Demequina sp.]
SVSVESHGFVARHRGFATRLAAVRHFRDYLLLDRGDSLHLDAGNERALDDYFEIRGTKGAGPVDVNALTVALTLHPNI